MSIYVMGDIHGYFVEFQHILKIWKIMIISDKERSNTDHSCPCVKGRI